LGSINEGIVKRTATESLAQVVMQAPRHSLGSTPVYDAGGYQEAYSTTVRHSDSPLTSQAPGYSPMAGGQTHTYPIANPLVVSQQTNTTFEHPQTYGNDESGMATTHVAALAAASGNTPQPGENYGYATSHVQSTNGGQSAYPAHSYPQQDWRQWARTYVQPQTHSQPGEYLNTATTLMALGRDGGSQDPGHHGQGHLDNAAVPGHVSWPELAYPNSANGHGHLNQ
jgi:hypothetical protein